MTPTTIHNSHLRIGRTLIPMSMLVMLLTDEGTLNKHGIAEEDAKVVTDHYRAFFKAASESLQGKRSYRADLIRELCECVEDLGRLDTHTSDAYQIEMLRRAQQLAKALLSPKAPVKPPTPAPGSRKRRQGPFRGLAGPRSSRPRSAQGPQRPAAAQQARAKDWRGPACPVAKAR